MMSRTASASASRLPGFGTCACRIISAPAIQPFSLWIAALIYLLAGFARLLYFTLDKNPIPGFFKGMPTPAAALFVTAPLLIICQTNGAVHWGYPVSYFCFTAIFCSPLF